MRPRSYATANRLDPPIYSKRLCAADSVLVDVARRSTTVGSRATGDDEIARPPKGVTLLLILFVVALIVLAVWKFSG